VAKALPTAIHVAVGKEHVTKNSSAKKPLPPAKRKAVGKGNVRRYEILCRLSLLAGVKGFFANCLYWQVAKGALVISAQPNIGSGHEILAFV